MAQGLKLFADRALAERYAKHLRDALLEIGAPPPRDAVFFRIGAFFEEGGEFGFPRRARPGWPAWPLAVFEPRQAFRIIATHPVARRLAVHPAGFGRGLPAFALKREGDCRHPPCCLGATGLSRGHPQLPRRQILARNRDRRRRRLLCAGGSESDFR